MSNSFVPVASNESVSVSFDVSLIKKVLLGVVLLLALYFLYENFKGDTREDLDSEKLIKEAKHKLNKKENLSDSFSDLSELSDLTEHFNKKDKNKKKSVDSKEQFFEPLSEEVSSQEEEVREDMDQGQEGQQMQQMQQGQQMQQIAGQMLGQTGGQFGSPLMGIPEN